MECAAARTYVRKIPSDQATRRPRVHYTRWHSLETIISQLIVDLIVELTLRRRRFFSVWTVFHSENSFSKTFSQVIPPKIRLGGAKKNLLRFLRSRTMQSRKVNSRCLGKYPGIFGASRRMQSRKVNSRCLGISKMAAARTYGYGDRSYDCVRP